MIQFIALTAALSLAGCVTLSIDTPYGSVASDGKTIKLVIPTRGLSKGYAK